MASESRREREIVKLLEKSGCTVYKQTPPPIGIPDRLVVYSPGKHFWLEIKNDEGRLSPAQVKRHKWLRDKGECVSTVRTAKEAIECLRLVLLSEERRSADS